MRPIATDDSSMVSLSIMTVSHAKMDEPVVMLFGYGLGWA